MERSFPICTFVRCYRDIRYSRIRVDFFSPFAIPTSILTIVLVNQIRTNCHVTIECVPCFTIKFCCTADVKKVESISSCNFRWWKIRDLWLLWCCRKILSIACCTQHPSESLVSKWLITCNDSSCFFVHAPSRGDAYWMDENRLLWFTLHNLSQLLVLILLILNVVLTFHQF